MHEVACRMLTCSFPTQHTTFSRDDMKPASHKAPFPHETAGGTADAEERYKGKTLKVTTRQQLRKERRRANVRSCERVVDEPWAALTPPHDVALWIVQVAELRTLAGEPQAPPEAASPLAEVCVCTVPCEQTHGATVLSCTIAVRVVSSAPLCRPPRCAPSCCRNGATMPRWKL